MTVACPNCGTPNPAGFRFCGNCAAALDAPPRERTERRKVVTVLFCDVAGSTRLGEQRDPESMRAVMNLYFETVRGVLERHGGTVEKFIGDAVMAVFGHPVLHEDDALRAVRAADELRTELATLNERLRREWGLALETRMGINTGPVVAGDAGSAETLVTGDAVNVAARLQTAALEGETLIGEETYGLVRDAVVVEEKAPLSLKGKELPVKAWRLVSVTRDAAGHARRLDSPLVGREREQRSLTEASGQSASERVCVLFTLLGPAGVGKSRLVHEFLMSVRDRARILRGRCLPYGEGITFWPLAEVIKAVAGIEEADSPDTAKSKIDAVVGADEHHAVIAADIRSAIGVSTGEGSGEEIFWAFRRFFEILAADQPLVLVFDDIQWAEPTFLDLIEHISDWSRDAPIMLLCVARPELLELRPTWGGGKLHASTLMLESLPADDVAKLVDNLLGEGALAPSVVDRIAAAAEGNPLFVEEFVAMLIDDGLLQRHAERWVATGDLERVTVPPTIRSLLAARIDRLAKPERSVIERASVVGKVFWRGAMNELAPDSMRPEVSRSLLGLVRKELVRPDRSDFAGDDAFRFRHLLIRDAAYEALPKQDRAQLHERFAGWLERVAGERAAEYEEVLGYHLERAYRYRTELGPADDAAQTLALRAGRRLAAAGLRAVERNDEAAARKLLERAADLLPADHVERLAIPPDLAAALAQAGEFERGHRLLLEAAATAEAAGLRSVYWRCRIKDSYVAFFGGDPEWAAIWQNVIDEGIPELQRAGDDVVLAEAYDQEHGVAFYHGDLTQAARAARDQVEHARRAGDERLELSALASGASFGVWDERPLHEIIANSEEALRRAREAGRRVTEASALGILGRLTAYAGDPDEGRRMVIAARAILLELGRALHHAGSSHWLGQVEWAAGDPVAGEHALREGAEALEQLGDQTLRATSLGLMGVCLAEQGRYQEAFEASVQAEALAAADDTAAQVEWRLPRALALAALGNLDEAGRLADEVIERVSSTGYAMSIAEYGFRLVDAVRQARGPAPAKQIVERSLELFSRKGMPLLVARCHDKLAELERYGVGEGVAETGAV